MIFVRTIIVCHLRIKLFFFLVKEAGKVVDVQDIKHISEDKKLIGDAMEKIAHEWNAQRDIFYQQTGFSQHPPKEQLQLQLLPLPLQQEEQQQHQDNEDFDQELERLLSEA